MSNYEDPKEAADKEAIAASAVSLDNYEKMRSSPSQLVVFVSFDIVRSVRIKQIEVDSWFHLFDIFLNKVPLGFPMERLKSNGDEIIFAQTINDLACIVKIIEATYERTLQAHKYFVDPKINKKHYVKSTIWVAEIGDTPKNFEIYPNGVKDYIGHNVDEGFRLAGFASANTVTIDPKIVMLLAKSIEQNSKNQKTKKCLENIVFDGYQYLKDIWWIKKEGADKGIDEDSKQQKYPLFRYYTDASEISSDLTYIKHPELDFAKKSKHTNDDIIKMLTRTFKRAGVCKEVKNMLQVMKIDW